MKKATISVALDPEPAEEVLILTKSTGIKKKVTFVDELGQENMPPPVVTKARRGTRATATVKTVEAPGPAKPRATARRPVKRTKVAHTEETEVAEQVKTPLSPKKITQITRPLTVSEEQGTPKRASTQIAMRAPTPARPMAMRDVEMEHHPQHIATPDQLAVVDAAPSSPIRQVDAPKIGESPRRPARSPPATAARQPPKRFNPINLISTGMAISPAKGVSTNSPLKAPPQKFAVVPAEFGASHVAPTPGRASVTNTPARRPPRPMLATDELDSTASNSITTPGIRPLGFFGRSKTPGPGNTTTPSMAFQFRSVRPVSRSFQISPSRISKHSPLKAIAETPFRSRASGGLADLLMIDASMAASSPLRARGAGSPRDDVPVSGDAPPDPFSPIAFDTMDTPRMSLAGPVSIPTEMQEADGQVDQAPSFVLTSDMLNDDSMLIDDPVEEGANEVSAAPEDLADALQADDQTLHMSAIEAHHQPPQTLQNIMGTSFAEMILSQEDPLVNEVLEVDPSSSMLVEMIRPIPFSPVRATAASPQISESVVSSSRSHQDHGFYALNEPTSVRKLSYENEQAAREALNFGEEELVKSVIGKRMSAATAFEPPTLSSPIGKMTGVQVVEDMADPDIQQKDCQAKRKLFYENQVAVKEASLFAQPEEETTAPMPVGEDVQGSEQAEEALEGDVTPKAAERCITIATESPAAQSQEPGIASPSVDEMDARSAISEDLTEAEQAPSPAKSIPVFEDASLPQDDNATISAPPSTSANSESSAFDNNENAMPSIERPQTPEQQIQHKLKVFHTTAKIPLRPEGMMLMSPLRNPKRRASTAGFSPRKVGPKSPFGRRDLRAKERQEKIRAANTASASASASEKTPSELEPELSVVALEAQQQQTPVKQFDAEDASPSLAWSAFATPLAARTPRPPRNEKLLQGAVVFLDIRTAEGEEASACYQQLLGEMGARCVKQWVWNPDAGCRTSQQDGSGKEDELLVVRKTSRRRTEGANANVGITHVVFKDGNVRTMEKVRAAAGIVQCVTVRWVLE